MTAVRSQERSQDASGLVRRLEGGEQIDITVAGRLAARLVPAAPRRRRRRAIRSQALQLEGQLEGARRGPPAVGGDEEMGLVLGGGGDHQGIRKAKRPVARP